MLLKKRALNKEDVPALAIAGGFAVALLCFTHLPFFADMGTFSEGACLIFDKQFSSIFLPERLDTGGFPLFQSYLALVWTFFGKSLAVSHLAMLPIVLGCLLLFYRFCRRQLSPAWSSACMALLVLDPTFSTQSLLMSYDLLILFAILLSVHALLNNHNLLLGAGLVLLLFSGSRGLAGFAAIICFHLFCAKQTEKRRKLLLPYIAGAAGYFAWLALHRYHCGWWLFNPLRGQTHESLETATMMLKRSAFALWKLADLGRISWLLLMVCFAPFLLRRLQDRQPQAGIFTALFLMSIIFIVPFSVPVSHRYLLPVIVTGLPVAVSIIAGKIKSGLRQKIVFSCIILSLAAGNFILYPQQLGNGWDASLKVLPFFSVQDEVHAYMLKHGINPANVNSENPLCYNRKFTHLEKNDFTFDDINNSPSCANTYFLSSNVINTAYQHRTIMIESNGALINEWKKGQVYLKLYKCEGQ